MAAATPPCVMVIEDDADIREMVAVTLELRGYVVVPMADGIEALAWLRSRAPRPGLILLDLTMPRMSGVEFRTEQRRDPELAAIPVVVLTGASTWVDEAGALAGTSVLRKPVDLDTLLATVGRRCAGGSKGGSAP